MLVAAIFPALFAPLTNSVDVAGPPGTEPKWVWTGIGNAGDFSAGEHCNEWSSATFAYAAHMGDPGAKDGNAFRASGLMMGCAAEALRLYCVQQP